MKFTLLMLLSFSVLVYSQIPSYDQSIVLKFNGEPMNTEYGNNSPCVVDWNGDGKKDLLVGEFHSEKLKYYENIGENANPVFGEGVYLQADGEDIMVKAG